MGTAVEVRDEHGRVVTEGEGQVFIGEDDQTTCIQIRFSADKIHINPSDARCRRGGQSVSPG